jgi:hypothetical protein
MFDRPSRDIGPHKQGDEDFKRRSIGTRQG